VKVYVGSCIWRTVEVAHMAALVPLLRSPGFGYYPQVGDALIDRARGISATYFLEKTDCDVHLSIDSDIVGFTVEDTLKLCEAAEEYGIVGGVYVCRSPKKTYPASYYLDGEPVIHAFDHTPVEVKFLATGFMAVHRRVFEKLAETVPMMAPEDDKHFYAFYQPMAYEDEDVGQTIELSEDWAFCQRAKEAGFKVYIDPAIRLGHIGNYTYTLEDMLRDREPPQPLMVRRDGQEWSVFTLGSQAEAEAAKAKEEADSKTLVRV
jgi:hypothetical protein